MTDSSEFKTLCEAACVGSIEAFNEIFVRDRPRLTGILRRLLGLRIQSVELEDILQEYWLGFLNVICRKLRDLQGDQDFKNWTSRLLKCRAIDRLRSLKRHRSTSLESSPETVDRLSNESAFAAKMMFQSLSKQLCPLDRHVLTCRIKGMTRTEIAKELEQPEGTIASSLRRIQRVAKELGFFEIEDR